MVRRRAWLLNFDADEELSRLGAGATSRTTPPRAVVGRAAALAARVGPLLGPEDVLVPDDPKATLPPGAYVGRAFCPTPSALLRLRRAGAEPAPAPPLEVLRRVNHRGFCAALGQELPGARYVLTVDALEEAVAAPSPTGHWLLKRPFGFAGRGRRRVAAGALEPAARPWIAASLATGEGLQVEPWVERRGDFSLHGYVSASGPGAAVQLGHPCVQQCDAQGAWRGTARAAAGDLDAQELSRLLEAGLEAGRALAEAGYFGPFGIDAFRWVDEEGRARFNARGEINARYTMGWAVGMGELRPDLEGA